MWDAAPMIAGKDMEDVGVLLGCWSTKPSLEEDKFSPDHQKIRPPNTATFTPKDAGEITE